MNVYPTTPAIEPTQDERTFATLAHALQLAGWWIAPLVIFLVKKDSRFVRFHALQALLWQACYMIFWLVVVALWMAVMFSFILHLPQGLHPAPATPPAPPPAFFVMFPLIWLGAMGGWVITLLLAILYAIKAGRGEWAGYPVLGGLARRMLKL